MFSCTSGLNTLISSLEFKFTESILAEISIFYATIQLRLHSKEYYNNPVKMNNVQEHNTVDNVLGNIKAPSGNHWCREKAIFKYYIL